MKTFVAIRHLEINGLVIAHGAEIEPRLIDEATLNKLIDQGRVKEYDSSERRSLYRLFPAFSGAKEKQQLDAEELTQFGLP